MLIRPLLAAVLALGLIAPAQTAFARQDAETVTAQTKVKVKKVRLTRAQRKALKAAEAQRKLVKAAVHQAKSTIKPVRGRIWCVPFARQVSGIEIRGNAVTWWQQAANRYERGSEPRVGAVINFRASRAMPKGHVGVVSQIIDERRILVDQANWVRNRITVDTLVVDVSEANDWSQVRVANGNGSLGRVNPVFGFIYR